MCAGPLRGGLICFAFSVAMAGIVSCNGGRRVVPKTDPAEQPTLAVLIVFDQMRGDYPIKWLPLFEEGGFRRIADEGAWFQNCNYPYANTMTAPGHATISTGCSPEIHGIIANEWYSSRTAKEALCVGNERHALVPPSKDPKLFGSSPERLFAPTIGDVVKSATNGKGKVVALSIKDRSAVLPAGRSKPDAVYWCDKDGRFVTSTYYRDAVHSWVKEFNSSGAVDRYLGKEWLRSRPEVDYVKHAGFDDVTGEGTGTNQGRTFPHPFVLDKKEGKRGYYAAVGSSPAGSELLLELALKAIDAERLGRRDTKDFLSISFSSNDLVGHAWGPDSQEVLDITLRSDVLLARLMNHLDEKVGKGKWVLALSADHGICPIPEVAKKRGEDAGRILPAPLLEKAEKMLDGLFAAQPGKADPKGKWIEKFASYMLYLNWRRIIASGHKQAEVETALARWLAEQPGIQAAYPRKQLEGELPESDPIGRRVQRSYFATESGDVTMVLKKGWLMGTNLTGTTHGGPHDYDRHVPLMAIGGGIVPGVRKDQRVSPEHAAVILTRALGMKKPARATVDVPLGLFAE